MASPIKNTVDHTDHGGQYLTERDSRKKKIIDDYSGWLFNKLKIVLWGTVAPCFILYIIGYGIAEKYTWICIAIIICSLALCMVIDLIEIVNRTADTIRRYHDR
jgi:hypothetical protein